MQSDAKYWATMVMSIIISFVGAIGTFALVIPPGINVVAIFLLAFPSGYAVNDVANRGLGLVQGVAARAGAQAANVVLTKKGAESYDHLVKWIL